MSKCQLEEPPFYQCCCVCKHHIRVAPRSGDHEKTQGYICALPLDMTDAERGSEPFVYGNWRAHSGGCECWTDRRRVEPASSSGPTGE